ncbi:hypothetical protein MKEN_00527100 [Mycena kentingensis (nom. inval.)]|nr:hypothetical protein MKEN_00527100 [Mycena kentingensis (nom. inval.)]
MFANALRRQALSAVVALGGRRVSSVIACRWVKDVSSLRLLSTTPVWKESAPIAPRTSQHPPSRQVYIGNLPYEANEHDVRQALEAYGHLESIRLILNPDGSSRGFGYAFFSTLEEAIAAFNSDIKIFNRLMRLDYTMPRPQYSSGMAAASRPPTSPSNVLYVGNLPFGTDEAELREKFAPFGPIRSMRLAVEPSGTFRGFGHIEFEREDDAVSAYESYAEEPLYMLDRNVRIDYAASRSPGKGHPSSSLYFFDFRGDGLALRSCLRAFESDILRTHFLRSRITGELTATGFVEFRSVEAATSALEKYNGQTTQFGPLNLEFAQSSPRTSPDSSVGSAASMRAQAGERVRATAAGGYSNSDF